MPDSSDYKNDQKDSLHLWDNAQRSNSVKYAHYRYSDAQEIPESP